MTWPTFDWLKSSASDFWNSWNSWTGVFCSRCPYSSVCVDVRVFDVTIVPVSSSAVFQPPSCDVSCVCAGPFRAVPVLSLGSGSIENRKFFFSFFFCFFYLFIYFFRRQTTRKSWMVVRYWLLVTTSASRGKPIKSKDPPLNILIFLLTYFFSTLIEFFLFSCTCRLGVV
jgi:hypothetical protein